MDDAKSAHRFGMSHRYRTMRGSNRYISSAQLRLNKKKRARSTLLCIAVHDSTGFGTTVPGRMVSVFGQGRAGNGATFDTHNDQSLLILECCKTNAEGHQGQGGGNIQVLSGSASAYRQRARIRVRRTSMISRNRPDLVPSYLIPHR
jgi:hypothetical protein